MKVFASVTVLLYAGLSYYLLKDSSGEEKFFRAALLIALAGGVAVIVGQAFLAPG